MKIKKESGSDGCRKSHNTLKVFGACPGVIHNSFGHLWKVPERSRLILKCCIRVWNIFQRLEGKGWSNCIFFPIFNFGNISSKGKT
jgi:hypothetical protein